MGVNEFGVVIGNEAIITKIKPQKTPSLLGFVQHQTSITNTNSIDFVQSFLF
jgi:hypothetical protein